VGSTPGEAIGPADQQPSVQRLWTG
jgi:hypothetical protein